MHLRYVPLVVLALATSLWAQAKYQAGPAGELEVRYGMPLYRDALIEQAKPGVDWRMGANGPTVMVTTTALVLDDGVIFPGSYTLTAQCKDETRWDLRFVEGVQQGRGGGQGRNSPSLPTLSLVRSRLEKEPDHTKKLSIELLRASDKDLAKLNGARFQLRFGPHQLASDFLCVPAVKKSLKLGKTAFEMESLKYPLLPKFEEALLGKAQNNLPVARLTLTKDSSSTLLLIESGEEPTLSFPAWNRTVKGKRATGQSNTKALDVQLKAKLLSLKLGTTALTFELDESLLSKLDAGGTTPSK